jgi:hypothetical protein
MRVRSSRPFAALGLAAALTACGARGGDPVAEDTADPSADVGPATDTDVGPAADPDAGRALAPDTGAAPVTDAGALGAPDLPSLRPPDMRFVCEPEDPDGDGDGTPDACDVCPRVPDATQADADGDGLGDACDLTPDCVVGAVGHMPCGRGDTGARARTCEATGAWGPWGECVQGAACDAGEERVEACGDNQRGLTTQRCVDGQWAPWYPCYDPDVCRDGAEGVVDCGDLPDSRAALCVFGQWEAQGVCDVERECEPGATRTAPCAGGHQAFACAGGRWRAASDCVAALDGCAYGTGPLALTPGHHTATVDTTGLSSLYTASCGGGAAGPETAVHLETPEEVDVVVRVTASTTMPVLHVVGHCRFPDPEGDAPDDPVEQACSDTGTLTVRLTRGRHVLLVDAHAPDAVGATTVEFDVEAVPCVDDEAHLWLGDPNSRVCVDGVWSPWETDPVKGCAGGIPGELIEVDPELALCRFCADAHEPNDTLARATPLALGQTLEHLTLCPVLDRRDDFAFDAPGPGLVTARATTQTPARGPWGPAVETGLAPINGWFVAENRAPAFVGFVERANRHYIRVDGRGLEAPLDYALETSFLPSLACERGAGDACIPCVDARDDTPLPLETGTVVHDAGLCEGLDARDAYTFTPPSAGRYRAMLTFRRKQGELEMRIVDAAGQALSQGAIIEGDRVSIEAELTAAPHRVEVDLRFGEVAYDLEVTGP